MRKLLLVCAAALGAGACGDMSNDSSDTSIAADVTRGDSDVLADAAPVDLLDTASDLSDETSPEDLVSTSDGETPGDAVEPDADEPIPEPPRIWVTVAEIPRDMNGSIDSVESPLSWRLRVNRVNVTIDVFRDDASGPVDWGTVEIACDDGDGERTLGPVEVVSEVHKRVLVGSDNGFTDGRAVVCRAGVDGPGGHGSDAFAFDAATLPTELDPFVEVDQWFVTTSRDMFSVTVDPRSDRTAQVDSVYTPGGNGVVDLDEALNALGLTSADYPEAGAIIRSHLLRRVRANVERFFGLDDVEPYAPRIRIAFEGTEEAQPFVGLDADALTDLGVSRIALGGDGSPADQRAGTFGRALVDWNNQKVEDDTIYGLGVFPTALIRAAMNQPIAAVLLEQIRPDLGGLPFGAHEGDSYFIGLDETPSTLPPIVDIDDRAFTYELLINFAALGLASILTHEMGHSLGLVPYGPPPAGLFAGVAVDFVDTIAPDAHIDTAGLNIMQTGGSADIGSILGGEDPAFEPLSLAYLRRMLVVGPVVAP